MLSLILILSPKEFNTCTACKFIVINSNSCLLSWEKTAVAGSWVVATLDEIDNIISGHQTEKESKI